MHIQELSMHMNISFNSVMQAQKYVDGDVSDGILQAEQFK